MKSNLKLLVLIGALSLPMVSFAGNDNANECGNNGNNCNTGTTGSPVANGGSSTASSNAVGVGIGYGAASATGGSSNATGGNVESTIKNTNTNLNTNNNANIGVNTSTNVNGQAQSTSNSNNSTNATTVNVQGDNFEARRIPVSTAYSNAPLPSATCRSGGALGVQSSVLGISLGGDRAVDTCEINEASRIAFSIGQQDMATELLCQNKWAKKTSQCQALVAAE
jgi:hypothetical protein